MLPAEISRRSFGVYGPHRTGEVGFFDDGDRFELIGGETVQTNPVDAAHMSVVTTSRRMLLSQFAYGNGMEIGFQTVVRLNDGSQPDLALIGAADGVLA